FSFFFFFVVFSFSYFCCLSLHDALPILGVFVVARQTSFFTHTLSEIGFSGAAFGVFAGISPLTGKLIFTMTSAIFVGLSGEKVGDRKSTRLNSSHVSISYAVFCLKKQIK